MNALHWSKKIQKLHEMPRIPKTKGKADPMKQVRVPHSRTERHPVKGSRWKSDGDRYVIIARICFDIDLLEEGAARQPTYSQ